MSALGVGLGGLGQGYAQGAQQNFSNRQQQAQFGLEQQRQALNEREQAQANAAREQGTVYEGQRVAQGAQELAQRKQFHNVDAGRAELTKWESIVNAPDFTRRYSPSEQERIQTDYMNRKHRILQQFPELSDSAYADVPGSVNDGNAVAPAAPEDNKVLAGPTSAPAPAPAQPGPFADVQNVGGQAVIPGNAPAPSPTEAAPVAGPPIPAAPTPAPKSPLDSAFADVIAEMKDPSLSTEERRSARKEMFQMIKDTAEIDANKAHAMYELAMTAEVAPNAHSNRAVNNENVAASQYERGTYKPALLKQGDAQLELEKLKAKQKTSGLTAGEMIQMSQLQFQIANAVAERSDKKQEQHYQHSKDAHEFDWKTGEQGREEAKQLHAGQLKIATQGAMEVDTVTHVPKLKKDGVQQFQRIYHELTAQGIQPTPDDINPGYPKDVWTSVNTPGFDVDAAIRAAVANNDNESANMLRGAYKAARGVGQMMSGAIGQRSKPAAKPAVKSATTTRSGSRIPLVNGRAQVTIK
jgi:hypothetical protein